MSTASQLLGLNPTLIGGIVPVSAAVVTTGTNFLKADGSDVLATDYPLISGNLVPSTSAAFRSLPGVASTNCGVAFGNGIYVAVPSNAFASSVKSQGFVLVSTDGQNWAQKIIGAWPINYYATCVSFLNGKFYVGVHYDTGFNFIYQSTDGTDWVQVLSDSTKSAYYGGSTYDIAQIQNITYVNSVYIAPVMLTQNNNGVLAGYYTSTDGTTWTVRNLSNGASYSYNSMAAFGNSLYVMVGANGNCLSSPDYITWTARTNTPTGGGGWSSVIYANSCFVSTQGQTGAGTSFGYSTDGITWTQKTVPSGRYFKVIYANSKFVAIGYNVCVTSTDGQTWTAQTVPTSNWTDITYSATYGFVAVSANGNSIIRSPDGVTWTTYFAPAITNFVDICYGTGLGYMAITDGAITSISSTGDTWTQKTTISSFTPYSIATNPSGSIYVAMNAAGGIYSTPDGVTWTSRLAAFANGPSGRVRWINDRFIALSSSISSNAVAGGRMYWSKDGITWTSADSASLNSDGYSSYVNMTFGGAAYGNGTYVVVGASAHMPSSGLVFMYNETRISGFSSNGISWYMAQTMPTSSIWTDVAFGNGVFVAVSKHIRNQVGAGRTTISNPTYGGFTGQNIDQDSSPRNGRECAVSTNGVDWTSSLLPFAAEWTSIVFNGHIFIAVASYSGNYATSKDGISWSVRSASSIGFWNNIAVGPSNTVMATSGYGTASALAMPGGAMKITESATNVALPYIRSLDGLNYAIRVK